MLNDGDLDRRLKRDGFTTTALLDQASALQLRERFLARRGRLGTGFSIDLTIDDADYRADVARLANEVLRDRAIELFADHEPFLTSFLCKYPGAESEMYLHQDWSYVDERAGHRTYVIWLALQDITGDNGQLRVLRGSHRLDPAPRGSNLVASFVRHENTITDRLLSVPVRAGEAIIFDNALVHSSFPNYSDEPRVALAMGMRPRPAELCYFRREGPGRALRYRIDEDFFFTYTPQFLLDEAPDLEPVESLGFDEKEWAEAALSRRLDRGLLPLLDRVTRRTQALRQRVPSRPSRA